MAGKLHKHPVLREAFPALTHLNHGITSPVDLSYNCVAWALNDNARWWWPDSMGVCFWPTNVPRTVTIEAFDRMLRQIGFSPCVRHTIEKGLQKVALYARAGVPTHVAKQLPKGKWSSKLGQHEDIEHTIEALDGPKYGSVCQVYARPQRSNP